MHLEGLKCLIACYPDGLKRIKEVYRQEVLGIEHRNPKGRRAVGVVRMKLKDYNDQKKATRKRTTKNPTELEQSANSTNIQPMNEPSMDYVPDSVEPPSKRRRVVGTKYRTTEEEMEVLSVLKIYKDKLPVDAITSVREQLPEVWTIKKVRDWWNYHKDK
jgi:hypothetical protein